MSEVNYGKGRARSVIWEFRKISKAFPTEVFTSILQRWDESDKYYITTSLQRVRGWGRFLHPLTPPCLFNITLEFWQYNSNMKITYVEGFMY
jgi:hypothetical protein